LWKKKRQLKLTMRDILAKADQANLTNAQKAAFKRAIEGIKAINALG
jgi:hypothetical protein